MSPAGSRCPRPDSRAVGYPRRAHAVAGDEPCVTPVAIGDNDQEAKRGPAGGRSGV